MNSDYLNSNSKTEYLFYREIEFSNLREEQILYKPVLRPTHVQSFINNISFPKTLGELEWFIYEHERFNVEDVLWDSETTWTAPPWAKVGDIVFFMHTKTAITHITRLITELNNNKNLYSEERFNTMIQWLERGRQLHKIYGGKIFAVAQVSGAPTHYLDEERDEIFHWGSRIYADMDNITVLDTPIDISEFNSFIFISRQSGITSVFGKEFDMLRKLISTKNPIPDFLKNCDATPVPLTKFNEENWITMSNEYRRSFLLESQFRTYYVDHLLRFLGDRKTIYKECRCRKAGIPDSFIDNVIFLNNKYLPVEVKLCVPAQANIIGQVSKYCCDDEIIIDNKTQRTIHPDKIHSNYCLVVDTDTIYLYSHKDCKISVLYSLDDLKNFDDIIKLKKLLCDKIGG